MLVYLDTLIGFAVVMLGASLLITIFTQMASALVSHRGSNLRWGLETLFQNVCNTPLLNKPEIAKMLANDILTHPMISDSVFSIRFPVHLPKKLTDRFRLATAISPDELVAILQDLATHKTYTEIAGLPAEITALVAAANPTAARRLSLLAGVPSVAVLPAAQVGQLLQSTVNSVRDSAGQLEAWFGATMDRVSQRFSTYARLWTIGFSCALAGFTGLNSINLLTDLYTHSDFRQQMAGSASQMLEQSNRILTPAGTTVEAAVQSAMTKMYTDAVTQALKDGNATADVPPSGIQTEGDGRAWIGAHVKDATQQAAADGALDKEIDVASKALIEQRAKDASAVRAMLTTTSFNPMNSGWKGRGPVLPQLPGVIATAALLSLGAPFWFNLLKSLTNLRPILANKQDDASK